MAIVKKYRSEVVDIKMPFESIYVVSFKSLEKAYKFHPGQFLHLALDDYNPSLPWPQSRCFSIQTSESEDILRITYAVQGSFTKRMAKELAVGKQIYLKLPYGELFTKPHSKEKNVFIAGGTGITPFLSLFAHKDFASYLSPKLYLGVRSQAYAIYDNEIREAQALNPSFVSQIVCQDKEGMLSIEKIFAQHGQESVYFISGPPIMIRLFKKYLLDHQVAEDNVRTDEWE